MPRYGRTKRPKAKIGPFTYAQCDIKGKEAKCRLWKRTGGPEKALPKPDNTVTVKRVNFRLTSDPVIVWPDLKSVEVNTRNMDCSIESLVQGKWMFCTNDKKWRKYL